MLKTHVDGVQFADNGKGVIVDLYDCPRCGQRHRRVLAQKFTRNMEVDKHTFTHYITCPVTDEPVTISGITLLYMGV